MKNTLNRWIGIGISSALFLAVVGSAMAQAPAPESPSAQDANAALAPSADGSHLTYQGRLANADGTPVTTPVNLTFRLYNDAGVVVYTESMGVTPINGLFTVAIGDNGSPKSLASTLQSVDTMVASIGVQVGNDPEMTPRQEFSTVFGRSKGNGGGVVGHGYDTRGVIGLSSGSTGVWGESNSYTGVYGHARSGGRAAVWGDGSSDELGVALRLSRGSIEIANAGVDTKTPVFVHKAVTGASGNLCSTRSYATVIDHPLTNNNPNAMLIVTPNYGNTSNGVAPTRGTIGVFYNNNDSCGAGKNNKWAIYNTDIVRGSGDPLGSTDIPNNALFNVMVINSTPISLTLNN